MNGHCLEAFPGSSGTHCPLEAKSPVAFVLGKLKPREIEYHKIKMSEMEAANEAVRFCKNASFPEESFWSPH